MTLLSRRIPRRNTRRIPRVLTSLAAAGALTLVAGSVAAATTPATAPSTGTASSGAASGTPEFSLAEAYAKAPATATEDSLVDLTGLMNFQGASVRFSASTQFDADSKRLAMNTTIDLADIAATGMTLPAGMPSTLEIPLLLDVTTSSMFLDGTALRQAGAPLPGTARFVHIDLKRVANADLEKLFEESMSQSQGVVGAFDPASARDVGRETIDGEELARYEVDLNIDEALASNPDIEKQIEATGQPVPQMVPAKIFVTRDNKIRLLQFGFSAEGVSLDMEIKMPDVTSDVAIELPADADVVELPEEMYQSIPSVPNVTGISSETTTSVAGTTP